MRSEAQGGVRSRVRFSHKGLQGGRVIVVVMGRSMGRARFGIWIRVTAWGRDWSYGLGWGRGWSYGAELGFESGQNVTSPGPHYSPGPADRSRGRVR